MGVAPQQSSTPKPCESFPEFNSRTMTDDQIGCIVNAFKDLSFEPTSFDDVRPSLFTMNGTPSDLLDRIKSIAAKSGLTFSARALGFMSTLAITVGIWHESGDNMRLKIIAFLNFVQRSAFLASNEYLISLISSYVDSFSKELEEAPIFEPTSGGYIDFERWHSSASNYSANWKFTGVSLANVLDKLATGVASGIDRFYGSQAMAGLNKLFAFAIAKEIVGDSITSQTLYLGLARGGDISSWKHRVDFVPMFSELLKAAVLVIRGVVGEADDTIFACADFMSWLACARWLIQHEHLRAAGNTKPTEGYVSDVVWRSRLELCDSKILSMKVPDPTLKTIFTSLSYRVQEMLVSARCAQYGDRPLPFNIGILSPPGTGKSTYIADSFIRTACEGLGLHTGCNTLDEYKKLIVTVNQSDKFMSSYKPASHVACIIDEMGASLSDKDHDNQIMTNITNLLGEGNWYINRASLQDKGKDLYRPHINVCISNAPMFGVKNFLANEALNAFTRRLHVCCEVRVKEAFRNIYTNSEGESVSQPGINLEALKAVEDRTSAVEFQILVPNEAIKGFSPATGNWISFREMSDYVRSCSIAHTNKTDGLGETREYLDAIRYTQCPHGYFDAAKCAECSIFSPTSDYYPEPDAITTVEALAPFLCVFLWHFRDTLMVAYSTVVMWLCAPFRFFESVDRNIDHYHATRQMIISDIYTAKTYADRVDSILARYDRYKEDFMILRSKGLYLLAGLVTGLIAYKAVGAYRSGGSTFHQSSEDNVNSMFQHNTDIVFTKDLEEDDYFPTASLDMDGGLPSGKLQGNPWQVDEGFIHGGSKSQTPAQILEKRLKRNLVVAEFRIKNTNKILRTHLFGVKDQYAVGVWHTLRHFAEGASCTIMRFNETQTGTHVTPEHLMYGTPALCVQIGPDLGLIKLIDVNAFRDVFEHFPVKAQYLGSAAKSKGTNYFHAREQPHSVQSVGFQGTFSTVQYNDSHSTTVYRSPVFCGPFENPHAGHCGSPLLSQVGSNIHINGIAVASNFSHKQVCFHVVDQTMIAAGMKAISSKHGIMSPTSSVGYEESVAFRDHVASVVPLDSHSHAYWLEPEDRGTIKCYGKLSTHYGSKMRSKVIDYPLKEALFKTFPKEYFHDLIAPVFNGTRVNGEWKSPERNALNDLARQVTGINSVHLDAAVDDLVAKFVNIPDFKLDRVWNLETCINGQPGTEAKAMPKKTSAGFGEPGKKLHHIEPANHEEHPHFMQLNEEALERFNTIDSLARAGKRSGVIYKTCPKDEPRAAEKVAERKIRIFTLGPMSFYLLCKKYFGGFMSIYTKNFLDTETVGGVNPFSKDWGRIYKRLSKFDNVVNGDFSKFDKKTALVLLMAAVTVMVRVKLHFLDEDEDPQFVEEYINAMRVIASEIANPLVNLDGSLLELPGSLSSGVLLTFILNDIVNSLYIRMAYYHCYSNIFVDKPLKDAVSSFSDNVVFYSLGDDNTYTISDDSLKFFNFRTIQAYFKSIGLKYTPADKSDNEYGSMPLRYASIGKRKWVFDEEYQLWLCPIEKPSIMKTLTIGLRSEELTPSEHEAACLSSALPELAQYGRAEFDARVSELKILSPNHIYHDYDYYLERQSTDGVTPWVPEQDAVEEYEWTSG